MTAIKKHVDLHIIYTYSAHLMNFGEQVSLKLHKYIRLNVEIIVNYCFFFHFFFFNVHTNCTGQYQLV